MTLNQRYKYCGIDVDITISSDYPDGNTLQNGPHQKKTTYWKTQDVETPGDPGKIRKRSFIDLDRTEKKVPLVKKSKTEDATKKEPMFRRDIGRNMY